jgi:lipopolysaccharide export system permease protein
MQILDRYILRQFARVFLTALVSLTGLRIVMDAFNHLDEFIRFAPKQGGLLAVLLDYYSYQSLYFFDRTCGILTLVAGMFTLTWLERHNELTAIQSAGIPNRRIVKPIVVAIIAITVLATLNREVLIPMAREKLGRSAQDLAGTVGRSLASRYDNETNVLFRGKQTFADRQRIERPNFLLPRELSSYGRQLAAAWAYYEPPRKDRPGGYRLVGVEQPRGLDTRSSLSLAGKPVLLTPRDNPWLKPGECFLASSVSFEQLEGGAAWKQFSSTRQLIAGLRNPSLDFGADLKVAIHGRIVQPLWDLTLVFLGLPLALSPRGRNVFVAIGMCVALVTAFVLVALGCQYLGNANLLNPALACWLPLVIFVPLAVGLSDPLFRR